MCGVYITKTVSCHFPLWDLCLSAKLKWPNYSNTHGLVSIHLFIIVFTKFILFVQWSILCCLSIGYQYPFLIVLYIFIWLKVQMAFVDLSPDWPNNERNLDFANLQMTFQLRCFAVILCTIFWCTKRVSVY